MDDLHSFLQIEISDDEKLQLSPSVNTWRESMEKLNSARLDFQSKMAVLCSGSIAVLASGAVAVVNSTALQHRLPAHFAVYVIVAATCLWLSLVCCTVHNYFAIALLAHNSESKMEESLRAIAGIIWKQKGLPEGDGKRAIAGLSNTKNAKRRTQRGAIMTRIQPWLVLAGVALFCIGYLAVVVFICIAVSSV